MTVEVAGCVAFSVVVPYDVRCGDIIGYDMFPASVYS